MRMIALPAAVLLGALLYSLLPQAEEWLSSGMNALLKHIRELIQRKTEKNAARLELIIALLIPAAAAFLLELIHPAVSALVMAPLFSFFALMPKCFSIKHELDSGKFVKDRDGYERNVLQGCVILGKALVPSLLAPLLLCAIGMPLHLGGALGWAYAAMLLITSPDPLCGRIHTLITRAADAVAAFLLRLCAGLFGRNPLRISGEDTEETMLNLLGLQEESDHAPISGDISQAAFACCLCAFLLCAFLTGVGMVLC